MTRIVVSMTTLPNRYSKLERTLETIKQQTLPPAVIYLGIPPRAERLQKEYPPLPSSILEQTTIVPLKKDYGPLCKILGALEREKDPDTIIITLDDDIIYPPNHLKKLVEKAQNNPEEVIATSGMILSSSRSQPFGVYYSICRNKFFSMKIPPQGREVDIICGFSGVVYRRRFFSEERLAELLSLTKHEELFLNDDILLSAFMSSLGIKKRIFSDFPSISYEGKAEETDLSYHRLPMLKRMAQAINHCRDLGWFPAQSKTINYDESFNGKTILSIVFVILFLLAVLVCLWMMITTK